MLVGCDAVNAGDVGVPGACRQGQALLTVRLNPVVLPPQQHCLRFVNKRTANRTRGTEGQLICLTNPSIRRWLAACNPASIMAARRMLDRQPGAAPEVRREGDSMTFVLEVAGAPEQVKLVLRCTQTSIYASVTNLPAPRE